MAPTDTLGRPRDEEGCVDSVWRRIEAWLQTNAPDVLESLREGATADDPWFCMTRRTPNLRRRAGVANAGV